MIFVCFLICLSRLSPWYLHISAGKYGTRSNHTPTPDFPENKSLQGNPVITSFRQEMCVHLALKMAALFVEGDQETLSVLSRNCSCLPQDNTISHFLIFFGENPKGSWVEQDYVCTSWPCT